MPKRIPEPEEILDLAQQLQEAKSRVSELQSRWAAYFTDGASALTPMGVEFAPQRGGTLVSQMLNLMEQNPYQIYTASVIAATLKAKQNSVGPLLSRLVGEQKIVKRGHGEYSAKLPEIEDSRDMESWTTILGSQVGKRDLRDDLGSKNGPVA